MPRTDDEWYEYVRTVLARNQTARAGAEYPIYRSKNGKRVRLGDTWTCDERSDDGQFGRGRVRLVGLDFDGERAVVIYGGELLFGPLLVGTHPRTGGKIGMLPV